MKYSRIKCCLAVGLLLSAPHLHQIALAEEHDLTPYSQFQDAQINESSGIVKSRRIEGLYWTHNDSGDQARIFAINRAGELLKPTWFKDAYAGMSVGNAVNIDWEDIAIDDIGYLYIGAFGNNGNARRDLAVYVVPEPNPLQQLQTRPLKSIPIAYPDQKAFPPKNRNFDCEALYWMQGKLYFLTKHRSNKLTKLYRLDTDFTHEVNTLQYIDDYNIQGSVTGADVLADGSKLAILTYKILWVFDRPENSDNFLDGQAYRLDIEARQCEAVCWDSPNTLIITNEQKDLFEVSLSQLRPTEASPAN